MKGPINLYLVCGGRWHDIDFARAELLQLLQELPEVRTKVAGDFSDVDAIAKADCLVTYTCDLKVDEAQQEALAGFVRGGKRWLALHGTNSVMKFMAEGVAAPRTHPLMMETLGSQFLAHPPIGPFRVTVSQPDHPLVAGIDAFEVRDELYLCEYHGQIDPLLETRFTGKALGFVEGLWHQDDPRWVMYLHPVEAGEVLYLTLGHCRGKYDMRPMVEEYPDVERGAWETPVYYELLRRSLRWTAGGLEAV